MTRREKKRRARNRRRMRRDLVHATGCALYNCCTKIAFVDIDMVNEACAMGVRVPRSLSERRSQ